MRTLTAILMAGIFGAATLSGQSLYDWNLKANWDASYGIGAEGAWGVPGGRSEIVLHYHRFVVMRYARDQAAKWIAALGLTAASRVAVINCGFGWEMEALAEHGITQTVCATTSTYIQSAKNTNEDEDLLNAVLQVGLNPSTGDGLSLFNVFRGDGSARARRAAFILNEALDTQTSRQKLRNAIGGPGFDVVTAECYLSSHTDMEALALSDRLHKIPGVSRVLHTVCPSWANVKTLAQWKALLPNDSMMDWADGEVVP